MKKIVWCLLLFLLSSSAHAQKLRTAMAEKYYRNYQFLAAAQVYENLYDSGTKDKALVEKLVTCYTRLNDPEKAQVWMEKSLENGTSDAQFFKNYALILASNNRHEEAKSYLEKAYLISKDIELLPWINSYSYFSSFYKDSALFKVNQVNYNSAQSDFSPAFFGDGIIFCSARDNGKLLKYKYDYNNTWFIDLYYVKDSSNVPTQFNKRVNSKYHEGPLTFNTTQDTVYFTRNEISKKPGSIKDSPHILKIYFAPIKEGKWGKIQAFTHNNPDYSIGHPSLLSTDEMVFVSDKPGGYGGTDLYKTKKVNGVWQTPVNLGPEINTTGNEMFPFSDENGTIYFASNGHPGLGGLDLFRYSISEKKPSVKNMGFPINSSKDDFGLIINNNSGYFSSNRSTASNEDNIYHFVANTSKAIYILAKDEANNSISDVDLLAYDGSENQNLKINKSAIEFKWDYDHFQMVVCSKQGYTTQELILDNSDFHKFKDGDTLFVFLAKIEEPKDEIPVADLTEPTLFKSRNIGETLELDIKYDVNKANINEEAADKLDLLILFLETHPNISVELGSHSDSRGSAELNQNLSQKRAESAVKYIVSKGIDQARLRAIGYGKNQPKIAHATTAAEHQQNRRTTVKIIGN